MDRIAERGRRRRKYLSWIESTQRPSTHMCVLMLDYPHYTVQHNPSATGAMLAVHVRVQGRKVRAASDENVNAIET